MHAPRILSALILGLSLGSCAAAPPAPAISDGDRAPEFHVTDQHGQAWSLANSSAHPLLIDFWATWCAPCLQALPDLQRFADAHGQRVSVLGLSTDLQGWAVVRPVLQRQAVRYPIAIIKPALSNAYGARAYPHLVLVSGGRVVKRLRVSRCPAGATRPISRRM